ncbi:GNAT family N-acetyltransferase [Chryseobacterium sp. MP_3.2]|uniref:GNAT family N-acetyltransferase n=1 Tax=Chryseobacterium sp. MP_3.2 TaxID=3071712 RepID=UPI002E0096E1|nr:ribosomal-protein-alanine N-acetyltransferase [Chryseobacterium sp. MP_3.2]
MKKFETERLFLEEISLNDAEFILRLYNTPKFIEHIGDKNLRTVADAEKYINEKFLPQLENLGYGNYLIRRKLDGQKIGAVGIFTREGLEVSDIGFSFLEEFEGNGYGQESASKLLEKAFLDFGLKTISAITTKENHASQNLIKKLGLTYLKIIQLPDDPVELLYFEITKESWLNHRKIQNDLN